MDSERYYTAIPVYSLSHPIASMPCNQCGECCRVLEFRFVNTDPDPVTIELQREFYETRGCTFDVTEKEIIVRVPIECPHLDGNLCSIYETRPEFCKIWGDVIKPTLPECGYYE